MEGEWKKAARAGSSSSFYWGNENPDAYSWHKGNADKNSPYRFQKKTNVLGIYDMAGNFWESTLSEHETGGKVVRGGSWRNEMVFLGVVRIIHSIGLLISFSFVNMGCSSIKHIRRFHQGFG